jgi:putative component of toxin-antitoxin plasmid stabilization module
MIIGFRQTFYSDEHFPPICNFKCVSILKIKKFYEYKIQKYSFKMVFIEDQTYQSTWRDLPGHTHGKLFIGKLRKKRADNLLKLSRHLLRLTFANLTGHAPVRGHLYTMRLFDGDPTCRFCRKETETVQHIICSCEALARQRYNVFGNLSIEPKEISTASAKDLYLYIKGRGLLNLS